MAGTCSCGPVDAPAGSERLTPYPGRVYGPGWRGRYPHLMPIDRAIWERFLERNGSEFLGFQYDIMLGEGADPVEGMSERDKRLLYSLTVKRVDCLGVREDGLVLFEVKPRLGMAAMGQLVVYNLLWKRRYGIGRPITMAWVGEQSEPDHQYVANQLGFRVVVV